MNHDNDEISLKELLLAIREYSKEIQSKWFLVLISLILGAITFGGQAFLKETTYSASLTFMVNEDNSSGGMGGAAAVLGQFGLGGGGGSEYNLDKIIAIARSSTIINLAIQDSISNGQLANKIIEEYSFAEKWSKSEILNGFVFGQTEDKTKRNKALKDLVKLIRGSSDRKGLVEYDYEDETGILSITANTTNAEMSIHLTEYIYKHLSEFYIKESTEKPKQNYLLLTNRADSVARELANIEQQIAKYADRSLGVLLKKDKLVSNRLQRNAQILTIMYGEIIKNKETADFILKSETPFFQILDTSTLPIEGSDTSIVKNSILGGIIFSVCALIIIIVRKFVREKLN